MSCRFNSLWTPSYETRIIRSEENMDETKTKQSKKLIDKMLSYIFTTNYLSDIALSEILKIMGLQRNYITMHYNLWKTGLYSIQTKTM